MFKNFTIQKKLLSGFLAVAVLAAIIGLYGSAKLKSLNKNDQFLYNGSTMPLGELVKMSTDFQKVRVLYRDMIRENNTDNIRRYLDESDNLIQDMSTSAQNYEKSITSDKGRELYNQFQTEFNNWKSENSTFRNLVLANKDEEAYAELQNVGGFKTSVKNIETSIKNLTDNKISRGETTIKDNIKQTNSAVTILSAILILSLALAVALGLFISSNIKGIIQTLAAEIGKMAAATTQGDLSHRADTTIIDKEFREIPEGFNNAIDIVNSHLLKCGIFFDQVANGIIPPKVTTEQEGDFAKMKDSMNQCIEGLNGLVKANNVLQKMAVNDYTLSMESNYKGIFAEVAEACNNLQYNLKHVVQIATNISKGDLCDLLELEEIGKRSENDVLIPSLMKVEKALMMITEKAKLIANGDLTVSLERLSDKDELMLALSNMVARLNEIVASIIEAAHNVATSSNEMSTAAVQISEGVSEQSSSAEEVSSSMEEMTSTIQQNSDNANQTEQIANKAVQGMSDVSNASTKSLDAIKQISEKIKIINDIASKTDILAINAAIEAARAGEQGKGFAVVAAEIRKLAEVSQNAAIEINSLSSTSLKITQETENLMDKIIPEIQKTAQLIQEVAVSSNEQKTGSEEITKAIVQFSQVTQQNAAAAEEMSSNSEELASQAELLKETIGFFNTGKQLHETKQKLSHISSKNNYKRNQIPSAERKGINLNLGNSEVNDENFEKY
ncbi:MAG: MCP four helix bundle domain-containing protein [Bacteroidota bacterium]|nr:MCP four helix bundle domain-containing protein [Bacteroidota bacterium]MDP4274569.1 MCP four helix bundle domain-containing protein [Bacteroidota bacterium]